MTGEDMAGQCATNQNAMDKFGLLPEELAEFAEAAVEIGCIDIAEELIAAAFDRMDGYPPQSIADCLERLRQSTNRSDRASPVVERIRQRLCAA